MRNIFKLVILNILLSALCVQSEVIEFRLDQDRIWLTAKDEPLSRLLERFAAAGIGVQIDPGAQKTISCSYRNADAETVLSELISPYDYLLDWRREPSPLGDYYGISGIRVFRKGYAESVKPLRNTRRIETSFDGKTRFMAREILIGFGAGASIEHLRAFLARTGGTVIAANPELGVYRILLPESTNVPDLVAQLGNDKSIAAAEPNYVYNMPKLLPGEKGAAEAAPGEWNITKSDNPIAVAVLDSGLMQDENLSRAVLGAYDATRPDSPLTADTVGHGTLMARLAAGQLDPYSSPVGEGVPVVAVKAFADDGSADAFTLMNAMTYAVKSSSGPVSLSWGSETPSQFIEHAVDYAINQGHPVFAAVGNENTGKPIYPAAYPGVVGVAASSGDKLAEYSNRGDFVDIVAPGSAGGSQGTSVATAYVAHLAALYMQHNPKATAAETVAALKKAAGPTGFLTESAVKQLLVK